MAVIKGGNVIGGASVIIPITNAGAPVAGTDQVWTLTITATSGNFRFVKDGLRSASVAFNAGAAAFQAALVAMPNIGAGGVVVASTGPWTITAAGSQAKKAQSALTTESVNLAGGTAVIANTTPGVDATGLGYGKGQKLVDTTNGIDYINTGTAAAPTWTKVGTQT